MDDEFEKTIFTFYFNVMFYMGFWVAETDDRLKKLFYVFYSNLVSAFMIFMSYMGILDLIYSVPHINKVVYNVCINIFMIGTYLKAQLTIQNSERINILRRRLHRSIMTCKDAEEFGMYADAIKDLKLMVRIFHVCWVLFYPTWLLLNFLSDYWGERTFPLPSRWPVPLDINDPKIFYSMSLFHAIFSGWFLMEALSLDTSMFGLLSQIHREYGFLIKRITEFGEFCEDLYREEDATKSGNEEKLGETNAFLKKTKVKQTLGEIILRQKDLFNFSVDFEYGYNKSMFVHIFAGGTLLCVNGIQAMILSLDFDVKMAYQFGYVLIILVDILYLCWMTNRISTKCFEVGNAFYSIPWYKLDPDIQRDICLIILRSQKPPRITSGSFVELNLRTSMVLLKNIYSWLAMYRQVAMK